MQASIRERILVGFLLLPLLLSLGRAPLLAQEALPPNPKAPGLTSEEKDLLAEFENRHRGIVNSRAAVDKQSDKWRLQSRLAADEALKIHDELVRQFKSAAFNIAVKALANATKLNELINRLPKGKLGDKLKKIMRKPRVQKMLKAAEGLGNTIEAAQDKLDEYQGRLEELENGVERYKILRRDGPWALVKKEIQDAVNEKVEEIIPVDLSQPVNEVVVDGFIHIAGKFPGASSFTPAMQWVADRSKELVRLYKSNRDLNNLEEERLELNKAKERQAKMEEEFRDDPMHEKLGEFLKRRALQLLPNRMALTDKELLVFDMKALKAAQARYREVGFTETKYADNEHFEVKLKDIDAIYEKLLEDREKAETREIERRVEEQEKRNAKARADFAKSQGNQRLGRSVHEVTTLVLTKLPDDYQPRRAPQCLAADLETQALLGCSRRVRVTAGARLLREVIGATAHENEPFPDKNLQMHIWKVVNRNQDMISRVGVDGPATLKSRVLEAQAPGIITVFLPGERFGEREKKSFSHRFLWEEDEVIRVNGKRRTVKRQKTTVRSYTSEVTKLESFIAKEKIPAAALKSIEYRTLDGKPVSEDIPLTIDQPAFRARVTFQYGNGEETRNPSVKVEKVREEKFQTIYRIWIEPRRGTPLSGGAHRFGVQEIAIARPTSKLEVSSGRTHPGVSDFLSGTRFVEAYGPVSLAYEVEGPLDPEQIQVRWSSFQEGVGSRITWTPVTGGGPLFEAKQSFSSDFRSLRYPIQVRAELFHADRETRITGRGGSSLEKRYSIRFRAPRIRKVELVTPGGRRAGSANFWTPKSSAVATARKQRNASLRVQPKFTDEFGRSFLLSQTKGTVIENATLYTTMALSGEGAAISSNVYDTSKRILEVRPNHGSTPGSRLVWANIPGNKEWPTATEDARTQSKRVLATRYVVEILQARDEDSGAYLRRLQVRGGRVPAGMEVEWVLRSGTRKRTPLHAQGESGAASMAVHELRAGSSVQLINEEGRSCASFRLHSFQGEERAQHRAGGVVPAMAGGAGGQVAPGAPAVPVGGQGQNWVAGPQRPEPPGTPTPPVSGGSGSGTGSGTGKIRYEIISMRTVTGNNPLNPTEPYRNFNNRTADNDEDFQEIVEEETNPSKTTSSSGTCPPPDACGNACPGGSCNPASAPCVTGAVFPKNTNFQSSVFMDIAATDAACVTPPGRAGAGAVSWTYLPGTACYLETHNGWTLEGGGTRSATFASGTHHRANVVHNLVSPTSRKVILKSNVQATTVTTRDGNGNVIGQETKPVLTVLAIRLP